MKHIPTTTTTRKVPVFCGTLKGAMLLKTNARDVIL